MDSYVVLCCCLPIVFIVVFGSWGQIGGGGKSPMNR